MYNITSEDFIYEGLWWLPETPENKIAGRLYYHRNKGASLQLIGTLMDMFERVKSKGGSIKGVKNLTINPDIILGITKTNRKITLYKCSETEYNIPDYLSSSFIATMIFEGVHFERIEDIIFHEIFVNYFNIDTWANFNGFTIDMGTVANPQETIVKFVSPNPIDLVKIDDFKLSLVFKPSGFIATSVQKEVKLEQKTFVNIKFSEKESFFKYEPIIGKFLSFLSLAMMKASYPVTIEGRVNKEDRDLDLVKIYSPTIIEGKKVISNPNDMLFTYHDVSTKIDKLLTNWFYKSKPEFLEPTYQLYISTLYDPGMYTMNQFLNLVQAIESYHSRMVCNIKMPEEEFDKILSEIMETVPKKYNKYLYVLYSANRPTLSERLNDIYKKYGDYLFSDIFSPQIIDKIVITRNYLTHYDLKKKDKTYKEDDLYYISVNIRAVLEICLLNEIGLSIDEIKKLFLKNTYYRHMFVA